MKKSKYKLLGVFWDNLNVSDTIQFMDDGRPAAHEGGCRRNGRAADRGGADVRRGRGAVPALRGGGRARVRRRARLPRAVRGGAVLLPLLPGREGLRRGDHQPCRGRAPRGVGRGGTADRRALPPLPRTRARGQVAADPHPAGARQPHRALPRRARAHPRRERHGQGDGRPADPQQVLARQGAVLRVQLRKREPLAAGEPLLRTREGRVHRGRPRVGRPVRAGERRHALPRRDRRAAARRAGHPPARPRGRTLHAHGRQGGAIRRRAAHHGDEPQPARTRARGQVPRRPLPAPERGAAAHPRAARAQGGHPRHRGRLVAGPPPPPPHRGADRRAHGLRLSGERARAPQPPRPRYGAGRR